MKGTIHSSGSTSQHGEELMPSPVERDITTANIPGGIVVPVDPTLVRKDSARPSDDLSAAQYPLVEDLGSIREDEKTVISQRPIAAPDEFLRSMPLHELATLLEGKQLDHFQVDQMIGGGGMGAVFRGRDLRLDRTVAIKVIPASKRDADTLRRFRQEAQSAARLDHPNIARVYYVGEAERWNYIVFEFIAGVNVRDLVDMNGPLSIDDAVFYTRQVAEALQHASERNVVHRDIKPSNLLITPEGAAKVVDMGLARDTSMDKSTADETASGVTLGTFDYISPEQARDPRDADVRSDLYSLGCTLFFMLTGNPPFPEGTALQKLLNHGSQPPPDPRGWREDMSDELYEILMKLMAKRPADRYQRPVDLINDLLLLAEAEDLLRSRTPGAYLITAGATQRSLLEANLPWLVGLCFLLGSTLWLQSVQSLSGRFKMPGATFDASIGVAPTVEPNALLPIKVPTSSNSQPNLDVLRPTDAVSSQVIEASANSNRPSNLASNRATNEVTPDLEESLPIENPEIGSAGRSVTALVVSERLPTGVDRQAWTTSLANAIRRAELETEIRSIEIAGRVVVDSTIRVGRPDLIIRSASLNIAHKSDAVLEFSPQLVARVQANESLIHVGGSSLQCLDLNFEVRLNADAASRNLAIFGLSQNGKLDLDGCRVTVKGAAMVPNSYVIDISDPDTELFSTIGTGKGGRAIPKVDSVHPTSLTIKNTVIRGDTSLLRVACSSRIELDIKHVLVGVAGLTVDVLGVHGEDRLPPKMRMYCNRSTFASAEGFARFNFRKDAPPSLSLNRTSRDCVYWSQSGKPHIYVEGLLRSDDLDDLLLLQGGDNAYASQIEQLCKCRTREQMELNFEFSGEEPDWFKEYGSEWSVSWNRPIPSVDAFSELAEEDFSLAEGMFMPGYSARNSPPIPGE
jgi:eukaryotic-like serine/threonine-protein kinase